MTLKLSVSIVMALEEGGGIKVNKNPEKFAIEFIIRNGHKLEEENNNFARQVGKLAVEALERQIPVKVMKSNYKYKAVDTETNEIYYYDASKCPKCDKWLTKIYKHCPHCGQRIVEV